MEPAGIPGTLFERQVVSGEARARRAGWWGPFASGALGHEHQQGRDRPRDGAPPLGGRETVRVSR